jgi:cytochrome o ubiquinol oxidase operon protein cyoD
MESARIGTNGADNGSLKKYITGYMLALVLTLIPFALVMSGRASRDVMLWGIGGAGIAQILVHLHYFLHLDTSSASRWNVMVLVFTFLIMGIFVGGTLWVMYTLNSRMMW